MSDLTSEAQSFRAALKAHRRSMTPQMRKKTQEPNIKGFRYPWAIENAYYKFIASLFAPVVEYVNDYFKRNAPDIIRGDSRRDALPGPAYTLMAKTISGWLANRFPEPDNTAVQSEQLGIAIGVGQVSDGVMTMANNEWQRMTKKIIGFEWVSAQSWYPAIKTAWVENNYKLIRTIAQTYIGKVNDLAEKATLNGWSANDLRDEILRYNNNLTEYQAHRLARDQVGKLNGFITRQLQTEVGLEIYEWMTAGDERVRGNPSGRYPNARPSHYVMDGKLCRYDNADVWSKDEGETWDPRSSEATHSHPGYDIQCRCTSLPYVGKLIREVDNEIDQEGKKNAA